MGQDSEISWTHHTFNPWWGCAKVSPACHFCYAERWSRRLGGDLWGSTSPRRFFGDAHWREPLKWNRRASLAGRRARVFCASMADVFEDRRDLDPVRDRLWDLIAATPSLDWLLLTKRPEHVPGLVTWTSWPVNVWLGTTAENQEWADVRVPALLKVPAAVRFLSCEPLLGPLTLGSWISELDWIIGGGESGPQARQMRIEWIRSLRDECTAAAVPFHFKQWGEWGPTISGELSRVGKKTAGRILDGETWDEFPASRGDAAAAQTA